LIACAGRVDRLGDDELDIRQTALDIVDGAP